MKIVSPQKLNFSKQSFFFFLVIFIIINLFLLKYILSSNHQILKLQQNKEHVLSLAWSPDGALLVSGTDIGNINFWDTSNWDLLFDLGVNSESIQSIAWSPDGLYLASIGFDLSARIWNTGNWTLKQTLPTDLYASNDIRWSSDGNKLMATGRFLLGQVQVWDLNSSTLLNTFTHANETVALDSGVSRLAVANEDGTITIYPVTAPNVLEFIRAERLLTSWSPDDKAVAAVGKNNMIYIWDVSTGNLLASLTGHTQTINNILWDESGERILSVSADNSIRIWNLNETGASFTIQAESGKYIFGNKSHINWHSESDKIAAIGGKYLEDNERDTPTSIFIWDTKTGNSIATLEMGNVVATLAWSPDGRLLASGGWYGLGVWDTLPEVSQG